VYADSDSEDDPRCQVPEEIVNETPKKVKSPRKTRIKSHKLLASNLTPQSQKKKHMKAHSTKKTYPNSEGKELQQVLEAVNSCNKRIDNLETITANLDKNLTNSVFDCRVVNNMVCELKSELSTSIDSKLKHQLSVMREDQNNFKNEMEEKLKKAEAEVKRLQGRVGSLVEEKPNLLKRIKSLENDNKTFKDEVSLLNTATKVNYNDDINTNPTLIQR
jgi:glycerol-3-phosphate cytidylyltransferase-like family protein